MDILAEIKHINALSETKAGHDLLKERLLDRHARLDKALAFAKARHAEQVRKYLHIPYHTHPTAVASIAALVLDDVEALEAAILHDVVEDTDTSIAEIVDVFGPRVAMYVDQLTDRDATDTAKAEVEAFKTSDHGLPPTALKRRIRGLVREIKKRIDREHNASGHPNAQTVKVADLIHNSFSIAQYDPSFARVFLAEKALLLEALTEANVDLRAAAHAVLKEALLSLGDDDPYNAPAAMSTFL